MLWVCGTSWFQRSWKDISFDEYGRIQLKSQSLILDTIALPSSDPSDFQSLGKKGGISGGNIFPVYNEYVYIASLGLLKSNYVLFSGTPLLHLTLLYHQRLLQRDSCQVIPHSSNSTPN